MAMRWPLALRLAGVRYITNVGDLGSGVGRGGGAGGAVREAGGAFGRLEASNEEIYFRRLQALQLKRIREHLEEEVDSHEKSIREHQEAIERHKKKIQKLQHQEKDNTV